MSKIIFIEPQAPNLHIFSGFKSPRLGIFILGTIMRQRGWEVEIFVEDLGGIDWDKISRADMVGISSITSTAPRAYTMADRVREMGIPVIMGGPHPTFLSEEALDHADFVIRGEGEHAIQAFFDAWENGRDFSHVPNLSYRTGDKTVHNPLAPAITDLDEIPIPDLSLSPRWKETRFAARTIPVQTSRGCPFLCSFCSVTPMFGRKYRFRSVENIMQEIRRYRYQKAAIFFYDDNFAADTRHTKKLLEAMIEEDLHISWSAQVRADVTRDPGLIALMKKAGCHTVFIGFESVNPASLKAMNKNQKVADVKQAVKVFRRHGIHIHGMFILGTDQDDLKSVKETVRFARGSGITSVQFLILTPLPGAELYAQLKAANRILFNDWSLYDTHHVVFKPKNFTVPGLQWAQMYSHRKFYSWRQRAKKLMFGNLIGVVINFYAHRLNRVWKKQNKTYLRVLKLLKPNQHADISIDYREKITLNLPAHFGTRKPGIAATGHLGM